MHGNYVIIESTTGCDTHNPLSSPSLISYYFILQLWRDLWGLETPPCLKGHVKEKSPGWRERLIVGDGRNSKGFGSKRYMAQISIESMVNQVSSFTPRALENVPRTFQPRRRPRRCHMDNMGNMGHMGHMGHMGENPSNKAATLRAKIASSGSTVAFIPS